MQNKVRPTNGKLLKVLLLITTMMIGQFILGSTPVHAAAVTEDFESVTIVDANGNEPASVWTPGAGLSNGWKIIGGAIYTSDTGDYQLVHNAGKGWLFSDYYLSSSSTSANSAYVFIPVKMAGTVQFFAKSTLTENSKKTSSVKIYEATADGTVTSTVLYSANPPKGASNWGLYTFDITEEDGKYIAINLIYTDIDDVTYYPASEGGVVVPTLNVSATAIDFGTTQAELTQSITVTSNVTTNVAMTLSGEGAAAFSLVDAPSSLTANTPATVNIKMSATAAGTYTATLTITAGTLSKKVVLTGIWEEQQPDVQPENWKGENFDGYKEDDAMPMGWMADGWSITEPFLLDNPPVVQTTTGGTLRTPVFEVTANQALQFFFQKSYGGWGYDSKLVVSYSTDKEQWTEAAAYDKNEADGTKKVALPAAGSYYVRFVANDRTYLDDFLVVDNTETSISNLNPSFSYREGVSYDFRGQRVQPMANGLYIINGKKVIKK